MCVVLILDRNLFLFVYKLIYGREDNGMKELMEFDYVEVDRLLYPRIEIDGKEVLDNLGKYGRMRLDYLREHRPGMYRELLVSGRLAGHCKSVDELGFEMAEAIWKKYLTANLVLGDDFFKWLQIHIMAQQVVDEIISKELLFA